MTKKTNTNEILESSIITTENVGTYNDLLTIHKSKSQVIRYLNSTGMDTKTIHKFLTSFNVTNEKGTHPIRYQHVRNVLNTIVKKS